MVMIRLKVKNDDAGSKTMIFVCMPHLILPIHQVDVIVGRWWCEC